MRYAFAYGADAVYAGIPKFSLRAKENPFKNETLKAAIQTAHDLGRKIYVTANILPPNRKLDSFKRSLAYFADAAPDGMIMSDPGMIAFARKEFPEIPVHLSVQTNTINWMSVAFWSDLGVRRTILSRELSIEEIRDIHENAPAMELEAFVHGSICIAYSGRCLLSNYFNHRDANQGTCTNSCRWEYNLHEETGEESAEPPQAVKGNYSIEEAQRLGEFMPIDEDEHGTYIMNSKDLRAIEFLRELRDAGVMSFKIEGRSKSIYYLSMITRTYRKALDDLGQGRAFNPELLNEIGKTANRGFTSAFLISNANHDTERFDSVQETDLPQVYGGAVVGQRSGGWMEVEVKNRLEVGDEMECVSPGGAYRFSIRGMENPAGEKISTAHGGNGRVWIPTDGPIEPFAILSRVSPVPQAAGKV